MTAPDTPPSPARQSTLARAAQPRALAAAFRKTARTLLAAVLRKRARWLQALTLLVGLAATAAGGLWMQSEIEGDARADFAIRVGVMGDQLESQLRAYSDVVYAVRALMEYRGSGAVTREEFDRFADSLAVMRRYPGLLNMSFSRHLTHAERDAFERRMRAEYQGLPPNQATFQIKPPGERPEYDVVVYLAPLAGNEPAVGLDLAAEPARNEAVRRTRDSGELATTRAMRLLRDGEEHAISVLLRLAVYDGVGVPPTVEARRSAYAGVAGVAIRLQDLIEATFPAGERNRVRLVVEDVTASAGTTPSDELLYDSLRTKGEAPVPVAFADYTVSRRIGVGNRTWEVRASPLLDPYQDPSAKMLPYGTAAAIFTIAVLLAGLLQSLHTANARGAALRRNVRTLEFHRQRLVETQEIADIGAWEWDVRQNRQVWSERLYKLLGRPMGEPPEPTDEFFVSQVVHPEDISMVRDALKRVLDDGKPVELECRVLHPDGSERIVSSVTRLETADDGARTRLVGTVRDITEQHRAAAREREQLVFIQTVMDAIPAPMFQKDPSGRFRACNDAWCQFLGKPRDAIIGRALEDLLPGPHIAPIADQDRDLLSRPSSSAIEVTLPNAACELRRVMVHKASYLAGDGRIAGLVGIIFDVTERKLAEERLRQTVDELDRRNAVSQLLGEFSGDLQSSMTIDEAHEMVAKYLPRLVPDSAGVLYRIDPSSRRGEKVVDWGTVAATPTLVGDACVAVRRSRPRTVSDSAKELNCRHFASDPPSAYACLPLLAHGELIGMLHVERSGTDSAKPIISDIRWMALTTAAEHTALAIANLALRETLREQATHDKLTGLYNRHYLNARFEQELARAKRKRQSFAVIMLDIDHFKRFNDIFGHAAGDHVLKELARVIGASSRKSDVACRYGGEEFVLFLPEASAAIAVKRAEEIREALKSLQLDWEGHALGTVTLSAGVATYPEHGTDPDTLLRFADRALYQAKQLGRDRVVLEPAPLGVVNTDRARPAA